MKNFYVFVLFFLFIPLCAQESDEIIEFAPTGAIPISSKSFSNLDKVAPLAGAPSNEPNVSWRNWYPTPGDQGSLNSCVPFAICYGAKTFLERRRNGWPLEDDPERIFSPTWIYGQYERRELPGKDSMGMLIQSGLANLEGGGCLPLSQFPYDGVRLSFTNDADLWSAAREFKKDKWDPINVRDVENLRKYVLAGHPIVFGARVDAEKRQGMIRNWQVDNFGVTHRMVSQFPAYHCMVLIGYNDEKIDNGDGTFRGAFEVMNSWGSNWGDGGYAWISYELWKNWAREGYLLWDSRELRKTETPFPEGLTFNDLKLIPPGPAGTLSGNWGYPEDYDLKRLLSDKIDVVPESLKRVMKGSPFLDR